MKLLDASHPLGSGGKEGGAEVLGVRSLAEARAWDDTHAGCVEEA